jgi:phage baseplate assembly protein W
MSTGLTPKLPLTRDGMTGYVLVTEYRELVRQNFGILMHTIPGERVMDANFGVGLRRYLFEPDRPQLYGQISSRIKSQVSQYLPYISIDSITFGSADEGADYNSLSLTVEYTILPLRTTDNLSLSVTVD